MNILSHVILGQSFLSPGDSRLCTKGEGKSRGALITLLSPEQIAIFKQFQRDST